VSDQDQPASGEPGFEDPGFDDPAFDDLRGLLAETRVTAPIPDDVAARLDATLGSLRDQRRADAHRPNGSVVLLRQRVGRVLVAAAAVAVIGAGSYGLVHSGQDSSTSDSAASSAGGQADADKAAPLTTAGGRSPGAVEAQGLPARVPSLRKGHFARDAAAAMRSLSVQAVAGAEDVPSAPAPAATPSDSRSARSDVLSGKSQAVEAPPVTATPTPLAGATAGFETVAGCAGPSASGAVTLPATLDGVPVALVFRPPTATGQLVEAWSCDGTTLLASATVPR
jgi:hypothetical protein